MDPYVFSASVLFILMLIIQSGIVIAFGVTIIKYQNTRTTTNYLLLNLLISDFISSCWGSSIRLYYMYFGTHTPISCYFMVCLIRTCMYVTLMSLILVSFVRYFKVSPSRLSRTFNKPDAICNTIMLIWLMAFLLAFVVDIDWGTVFEEGFTKGIDECHFYNVIRLKLGIFSIVVLQIGSIFVIMILNFLTLKLVNEQSKNMKNSLNHRRRDPHIWMITYFAKRHRIYITRQISLMTFILCCLNIAYVFPIVVIDLITMTDQLINRTQTLTIPSLFQGLAQFLVILFPGMQATFIWRLNKPVFNKLKLKPYDLYFGASEHQQEARTL
ncbi:Opsin-1, short-wave-sensitive 2 [Thelohanellus kitauei]|uniref:Opsin-1, short-wave-sensitive 2 n=1 Tax=Thelohanellus kitauei TaxID=669202 RepID=A0A0C2N4L9_THEKT|nr:Opsin-1, short-wave-sensitive 2 [Thelohanellus kitauei]